MSDLSSIGPGTNGSVGSVNRITPSTFHAAGNRIERLGDSVEGSSSKDGADRVELSDRARFLDMLRQLPDVRQDLVDRVKRSIQAGTYETEDKIDAALDKLAREEF